MQTTRTFRVFISSTFEDLQEERNALQDRVFPRLRDLCASHGARFQAIDLRWGVSAEAGLDQQTLPLCLEEIRRCRLVSPRPNFLVLLGDRYGWRPLPVEIPADEFEALSDQINDTEDRRLLDKWYSRDDNRVPPAYVLQPRTVAVPEAASSELRAAAEDVEAEQWRSTESRLRAVLSDAAAAIGILSASLALLDTSATEQEILAGALNADIKDADDHVLAFFRGMDDLPSDVHAGRFRDFDEVGIDTDAQSRLDSLKARLRKRLGNNVFEYRSRWTSSGITVSHLDSLCEHAFGALSQIIESELSRLERQQELDVEAEAHRSWGEARRHAFAGRTELCESIGEYLRGYGTTPLAVVGPSGSGKSAVMAETVARAESGFASAVVVGRYVGATPRSLVGHELLADVCRVVGAAYGVEAAVPEDYSRLVTILRERLDLPTEDRPLLLFLDGVDQLPRGDPAIELGWLPATLPSHVRIVISTSATTATDERSAPQTEIRIPPATESDAAAMLDRWLAEAGRTLTENQRRVVLAGFARCPLPTYLRLAFDEARAWHSYDPPRSLGVDMTALASQVLDRLSSDANHGSVLVEHSLAYLAAARFGLSEDEMIEILSADTEVMASFQRRSPRSPAVSMLPVAVWARLRGDLEHYLTEFRAPGATVLRFHHQQFEDTVRAAISDEVHKGWHARLGDFFAARPANVEEADGEGVDLRRLSEFPYQLAHAERVDELVDLLTDPEFLDAKVNAMGIQALLADFREARVTGSATTDLMLIEDALTLSAHVISDDPHQLRGQLLGRIPQSNHVPTERLRTSLLRASGAVLVPLRSGLNRSGEALYRTLVGHRNRVNRVAFLVEDDRVISSSDDGTDRVWDVTAGTVVRVVKNAEDTSQLWAGLPAATTSPPDPAGRWAVTARYGDIELSSDPGSPPLVVQGHNKAVHSLAFSADGTHLVSGSDDHTVRIWNLDRIDMGQPPPHPGGVVGVAVVGEDAALSAGRDGTIKRWSLENGQETDSWDVGAPIIAMDTASGGRRAVAACVDGLLRVLDLRSGSIAITSETHGGTVTGLTVSSDGCRAATACKDGVIRCWDLADGETISAVEGPTGSSPPLKLSSDGQLCACAYSDLAIRIWDVDRGALRATCIGHRGSINDIEFVSCGREVISASDDRTVRVWDAASGLERAPMYGHWHWVRSLTTDGQSLAVSIGEDYTVRVWDLATAAERFSLAGRRVDAFGAPSSAPGEGRTGYSPYGMSDVTVDRSGNRALSFFSNDDTLRLWDLTRGSQLGAFTCDQILSRAALSAEGTRIVAGTVEGQVAIVRTAGRSENSDPWGPGQEGSTESRQ